MAVELDLMEYADNEAARLAYVSSDDYTNDMVPTMTSNTTPSGEASASSIYSDSYPAWEAFDDVISTASTWATISGTVTGWLAYEFASSKIITKYTLAGQTGFQDRSPKSWTFEGWTGGEWVELDSQSNITGWEDDVRKTFEFSNGTPYIKYKIDITVNNGSTLTTSISEMEMMETVLQCYSEDTIKQQGSYSLKGVAIATDSLNDTLTRTI